MSGVWPVNTEYMTSNTGDGIAKPTGEVYGSEGKFVEVTQSNTVG